MTVDPRFDSRAPATRVGVALSLRNDRRLERGENGGTFRRRRKVEPVDLAGVSWACARTLPGYEFAVADDLAEVGFRTFCPHGVKVSGYARTGIANKRERRERDYPVFDSYLFVGEPPGLALRRWSHPHLVELVTRADANTRIPAEFVSAVAAIWAAGVWDDRNRPALGAGETVRITSGPFRGILATIEKMPSEVRAIVSFAIFKRQTRIGLDIEAIERI